VCGRCNNLLVSLNEPVPGPTRGFFSGTLFVSGLVISLVGGHWAMDGPSANDFVIILLILVAGLLMMAVGLLVKINYYLWRIAENSERD
jgi:hypothetical protein